jgi:hypothetical protein
MIYVMLDNDPIQQGTYTTITVTVTVVIISLSLSNDNAKQQITQISSAM